jgi:hypothetical protein
MFVHLDDRRTADSAGRQRRAPRTDARARDAYNAATFLFITGGRSSTRMFMVASGQCGAASPPQIDSAFS